MDPPSLKELAALQCMRSASYITDVGNIRYELLRPVLSRIPARQLRMVEEQNPQIYEKSDELWRELIIKDFPDRSVPSSQFRASYYRLQSEKDEHLGAARERLIHNQKRAARKRAHSSISITEHSHATSGQPHTIWRSLTMQQLAKQSSAVARQRMVHIHQRQQQQQQQSMLASPISMAPPVTPSFGPSSGPPLWSPAHSPQSNSPSPPSRNQSPPLTLGYSGAKRPIAPSEADRKRKTSIFIRR